MRSGRDNPSVRATATIDAIMKANPDVDVYNLTVGTELCIPSC